jgi:hypothetical protein
MRALIHGKPDAALQFFFGKSLPASVFFYYRQVQYFYFFIGTEAKGAFVAFPPPPNGIAVINRPAV